MTDDEQIDQMMYEAEMEERKIYGHREDEMNVLGTQKVLVRKDGLRVQISQQLLYVEAAYYGSSKRETRRRYSARSMAAVVAEYIARGWKTREQA